MKFSILTITRGEECVLENLTQLAQLAKSLGADYVVGVDGPVARERVRELQIEATIKEVATAGVMESVVDELLPYCEGEYVLRLDGDERVTWLMEQWLRQGRYVGADQWKFPRAWLWKDGTYLTAPHYWPDFQVRLSIKKKSGGLRTLHAMRSFGSVAEAPIAIEHLKLLMFSPEEREQHIRNFDAVEAGAGSNFRHFYSPESFGDVAGTAWDDGLSWRIEKAYQNTFAFPMAQYPDEIKACASWLLKEGLLTNVLEIGTFNGGTAAMWCELAENVVSIDLPNGPFGGLGTKEAMKRNDRLAKSYPGRFTGLLASSHLPRTKLAVEKILAGRKLDVLFIDGDHSRTGVTSDLEDYREFVRPGGVALFHDIVDTAFCKSQGVEVYAFWSELSSKYPARTREFKTTGGDFGGIGVFSL